MKKTLKVISGTLVCVMLGIGSISSLANTMDIVKIGNNRVLKEAKLEDNVGSVNKIIKIGCENILENLSTKIIMDGNKTIKRLADFKK